MANSTKPVRPRARGSRSFWDIQKARYVVQLGFIVFIGYVLFRQITVGESGAAVVPAAEAYCPLGGFESLYKYVTTGGQFVAHTHLSNMVLFVGLALSAIFAKSFFCGWVCPFGAIQQALTAARRWVQRRLGVLDRLARWMTPRVNRLAFLDRWLRWAKYLVLLWIIWGTIAYGVMVFRDVDPWAALLRIAEAEKGFGFVVLGAVIVAAVFGDRVWCRYACPLGAIVGLIGKISPIKIQREDSACTGCGLCSKKCPMGIPVHTQSRVSAVECNMCLHCVEACPAKGALELKAILPGVNGPAAEPVGRAS
jgi:polyferredoxin